MYSLLNYKPHDISFRRHARFKKRFCNAIILSRVQPDFRQLHEFRYATGSGSRSYGNLSDEVH